VALFDRFRRPKPERKDELIGIQLGSIVELRDSYTIENSPDHDPVSYTVTERRTYSSPDLRRYVYKLEQSGSETVFLAVDEDLENDEVTAGRFVLDNEHDTEDDPPDVMTLEFDAGGAEEFQLTFDSPVELAVRTENREIKYDAKIFDYESEEGAVLLIERCGGHAMQFLGCGIDRSDVYVYPSEEDEGKYIEELGA